MGKASKKKKTLDNTGKLRVVCQTSTPGNARLFKPVVQVAFIIILGIIVYSNTFNSPFVFDDDGYILNNQTLKEFSFFSSPSNVDVLSGIMGTISEQFRNRIFGHATLAINYKMHGLDVKGYHLFNLLIHLLNALLVYLLVILTFETPFLKNRTVLDSKFNAYTGTMIAFLCALLFVAHPIQTQAVTYISQRFTSLVTLFYLLSLALYTKARLSEQSRQRYAYYLISLVSAILAMKTKEISFTLPVVIAFFEMMFFEGNFKKRIYYLLPFLLTMAIIPFSLLSAGSSNSIFDSIGEVSKETTYISRSDYLFTQFSVIATYIRLLFLPVGQNLDYDYPLYTSFFMPQVWLPFLFLLSIFVLAGYLLYRSRKKTAFSWGFRLISFGIFYFFIALSVESSLIPIKDVIFEHRAYLPSFGFFLCFTVCMILIKNMLREPLDRAIIPALLLVIIILAGMTYSRNALWNSSLSLWEDTVKKSPMKARPHNELGLAYNKIGRLEAAVNEYTTAIKLNPNYVEAHHNLGETYDRLGRLEEAVAEHLIAIKLNPNAKTHNNLGLSYAKLGRLEEAVAEYLIAIKLNPNNAKTHHNLGETYDMLGRLEEAVAEYLIAIKLNPNDVEIHINLGVAYYKQGRFKDACKETLYAIKLDPNSIDAHYNLAIYYIQQGKFAEAIEEYSIVTKLDPNNAEAHNAISILSEELKIQAKSTPKQLH